MMGRGGRRLHLLNASLAHTQEAPLDAKDGKEPLQARQGRAGSAHPLGPGQSPGAAHSWEPFERAFLRALICAPPCRWLLSPHLDFAVLLGPHLRPGSALLPNLTSRPEGTPRLATLLLPPRLLAAHGGC